MTEPLKNPIGSIVHYYLEGWRYGYLASDNGFSATVLPIVPKGAAKPRLVKIPSDDIQKSDQ